MNIWDAFRPIDLRELPPRLGVTLFGSRNVGNETMTNLVVAHRADMAGTDETAILFSMYARTNFDIACASPEVRQAWTAWTSCAVASLIVGSMPCGVQHPICDLLGPRVLGNLCGDTKDDAAVAALAQQMFTNHQAKRNHHRPSSEWDFTEWNSLSPLMREVFLDAASANPFTCPVVIPVRQNFSVSVVNTDPGALEALLRVLPEIGAQSPLVWIHLSGLLQGDMA